MNRVSSTTNRICLTALDVFLCHVKERREKAELRPFIFEDTYLHINIKLQTIKHLHSRKYHFLVTG